MKTVPTMHKSTRTIHGNRSYDPVFGEVSVPIFQTSTFAFPTAEEGAARFSGEKPGYIYGRLGNPTVDALEKNISALENGFGAMLAFGVKNGLEGGRIVMNNIQLFTQAVSLGGVESLIEHPASMTHASIPRQERMDSGILDELIRVSSGCEHFEDLRDDLDQALNKVP